MASCWKPFTNHAYDLCFDTGQFRRNYDVIGLTEQSAAFFRFVSPCNTEKVERIDIPKADILKLLLDNVRNQGRIAQLSDCREDNIVLSSLFDIMFQCFFILFQGYHMSISFSKIKTTFYVFILPFEISKSNESDELFTKFFSNIKNFCYPTLLTFLHHIK